MRSPALAPCSSVGRIGVLAILRSGIRAPAEDFEAESGQVDGTPAHALERCFPIAAMVGGYRMMETEVPAGSAVNTVLDFAPLPGG